MMFWRGIPTTTITKLQHRHLSYGLHRKQDPVFGASDGSGISESEGMTTSIMLLSIEPNTAQAAEHTVGPGHMHSCCKGEKHLNGGLFFLFVLASKFCVPCTLMAFDSNLTPLILNFPVKYFPLIYLSLASVYDQLYSQDNALFHRDSKTFFLQHTSMKYPLLIC